MPEDKKYTQSQFDKAAEKAVAAQAKAVSTAVKEETKRVLACIKELSDAAKEIENKTEKVAVTNALKEVAALVKAA